MDIYEDEPFRRIVFDVVDLIKNSHDHLAFTSEKIEITSDEFFSKIENLREKKDLKTILELLRNEGVLNGYKVEEEKKFIGFNGEDWVADVYTLNINSKKLNGFLEMTNMAVSLKGLRQIKGVVISKNGMTMNTVEATLSCDSTGRRVENFSLNNKEKQLFALLMVNDGIIPSSFIYNELDISADNTKILTSNLRKIKSFMISYLVKELGLNKAKLKSSIKAIERVGIVMIDRQ